MDLGQPKRTDNGMARCTGVEDEASKFSRAVGGDRPSSSVPVTRFVIDNSKVFAVDTNVNHQDQLFLRQGGGVPSRLDFGSSIGMGKEHHVIRQCKERNGEGSKRTHNGDCSVDRDENAHQADDEDDDEEDDDDEGDGEVEGLASVDNTGMKNHNNSSGSVQSTSGKIYRDRVHSQDHNFLLGLRGDVIDNVDNGRGGMGKQKYQQYQNGPYDCAIATSDSEIHHARISPGQHTSIIPQVEAGVENGCRPCGSKVVTSSSDFAESLRMHLSDPITGSLMDDAVILFCGHSYGSSGMQHVTRMRACMRCGYPVSGDSIRPNFSLRAAVQAFLREEQSHLSKSSKRRRDGLAQGIFNCYDSFHTDGIRGKGVQFPFEVSDRVIIKGNKRTPTRFVGRIAVVTTQCLNGWYVVKTLDNAESVKLQYRSLAKVSDGMMSNKTPLQIGY